MDHEIPCQQGCIKGHVSSQVEFTKNLFFSFSDCSAFESQKRHTQYLLPSQFTQNNFLLPSSILIAAISGKSLSPSVVCNSTISDSSFDKKVFCVIYHHQWMRELEHFVLFVRSYHSTVANTSTSSGFIHLFASSSGISGLNCKWHPFQSTAHFSAHFQSHLHNAFTFRPAATYR